ncbi:hypothetical protein [Micromonospora sp. NPDC023956]|uniref:hypothetical protein n=1 Tax=Micromonospora sp. NPDC023956 TaxID=3155722 RepID=UPI0033CD97B8
MTPEQITTDAKGWSYLTGARFVTVDEWELEARRITATSMHLCCWPVTAALALAADDDGLILDFEDESFCEGPLVEAMCGEGDDQREAVTYNLFSSMALMMAMSEILKAGLVAGRRNGDRVDYRLTLPAGDGGVEGDVDPPETHPEWALRSPTMTSGQIITGTDGWSFLIGARFVDAEEWAEEAEKYLSDEQSDLGPLVEGLVLAADDGGLVLEFQHDKFCEGPLSDAAPLVTDVWDWPMSWDELVAMPLSEMALKLVKAGLLAMRSNGELMDYQLTLPAEKEPDVERKREEAGWYPPHRVNIDPWGGTRLTFEGASARNDGPLVHPTVWFDLGVTAGGNGLTFSYRALLTDEQVDSLLQALFQAREEARLLAAQEGWRPSQGESLRGAGSSGTDPDLDLDPPPF